MDSRLLVLLAVLASEQSWRVITFGDASPGVPSTEAPYRQVIIADADGRGEAAGQPRRLPWSARSTPPTGPLR